MRKRYLVIAALLSSIVLTSCSNLSKDVTTTTMLIEDEKDTKESEKKTEEELESSEKQEETEPVGEKKDENSFLEWTGKREEAGKDILRNETGRKKNFFDLTVDFKQDTASLDINQKLIYVNDSEDDLKEIYFNLIPNAYSKGYDYNLKDNSASDSNRDMVRVSEIKIGNETCALKRVKGTVYTLSLPEKLSAGDNLEINMKYKVIIPEMQNRLGFYNGEYNVGNFIITPAMYENGKWACNPYVELGDAFYTEIADYKVKINTPEGFKVAATGTLEDGTYYAKDVRDFAFFTSKKCEVISDTYDDININVYYPKKFSMGAKAALDCAKKSFEVFNELYGGYPYDDFDITMTAQSKGVGGMEYPGLIMVSIDDTDQEFAKTDKEYFVERMHEVVCHEIAHQWFYGIVGDDEINEPWLDESYANFSEKLYFYKSGKKDYDMETVINAYMELFSHTKEPTGKSELMSNLYDFNKDQNLLYLAIYVKGGKFHYEMYKKLGEEQYFKYLKEYVKTFAYDEVTTEEFIDFWKDKGKFKKLFKKYLYGNKTVDAM